MINRNELTVALIISMFEQIKEQSYENPPNMIKR